MRAALGMSSANADSQWAAIQADTDNLQARTPAALVSGRMDSSVGAYQSGLTPLQPTVAGRTVDVTATGEVGIDWANIGSPTTIVNLSGTTVGVVTANSDKTGYSLAAGGLSSTTWPSAWDAEVQSEANDALLANFLDQLFAAAYNPASKPGNASGLLNVLVESDAGVPRYTANALEQGPAGGGGGTSDWTAGERDQIRNRLGIDGASSAPSATPTLATAAAVDDLPTNAELATSQAAADDATLAAVAGVQSDTDNLQARTPAALVGGRTDASVGAMQANVMNAAAAATDLGAEIGVAVRDTVMEDMGSLTLGCLQAVQSAILHGDRTTTGGTTTWRDHTGTEIRAVSIITSTGNATFTVTCPTYP
jgi:hypothetical protein